MPIEYLINYFVVVVVVIVVVVAVDVAALIDNDALKIAVCIIAKFAVFDYLKMLTN